MTSSWYKEYTRLTDFIAKHPEIEINASRTRLPGNIRPDFYHLFDAIRTTFVEEELLNSLNEALILSNNYLITEHEVKHLLGLDDVSMMANLIRFLKNPSDELIRGLHGLLLDLIKAKISVETFKEKASRNTKDLFGYLYPLGYEKWVIFSLVKLLEADKSFRVIVREVNSGDEKKIRKGFLPEDKVPLPKESTIISFEHGMSPIFIVPDFIIYSAKINRYIAIRSGCSKATARASNAIDKRESYQLDSMVALEPSLSFIYVADNLEDISLVADAEKIYRPDLIIECMGQKDWFEKGLLEKVKYNNNVLQPKLGTYVVSKERPPQQAYNEFIKIQAYDKSAPEEKFIEPKTKQDSKGSIQKQELELSQELELEKQEERINILTAGFDQHKLEPIICKLIGQ